MGRELERDRAGQLRALPRLPRAGARAVPHEPGPLGRPQLLGHSRLLRALGARKHLPGPRPPAHVLGRQPLLRGRAAARGDDLPDDVPGRVALRLARPCTGCCPSPSWAWASGFPREACTPFPRRWSGGARGGRAAALRHAGEAHPHRGGAGHGRAARGRAGGEGGRGALQRGPALRVREADGPQGHPLRARRSCATPPAATCSTWGCGAATTACSTTTSSSATTTRARSTTSSSASASPRTRASTSTLPAAHGPEPRAAGQGRALRPRAGAAPAPERGLEGGGPEGARQGVPAPGRAGLPGAGARHRGGAHRHAGRLGVHLQPGTGQRLRAGAELLPDRPLPPVQPGRSGAQPLLRGGLHAAGDGTAHGAHLRAARGGAHPGVGGGGRSGEAGGAGAGSAAIEEAA